MNDQTAGTAPAELLCGTGYVFLADDGEEYSPSHPIDSGECPEATNIRRATEHEDHLYTELQKEWERAEALTKALRKPHADGKVQADLLEAAVECLSSLLQIYTGRPDIVKAVRPFLGFQENMVVHTAKSVLERVKG